MKGTTFSPTFGVKYKDKQAEICLWAPDANDVQLAINENGNPLSMTKQERGLWTLSTDQLRPGTSYQFVVDGSLIADPASKLQPEGPAGPSQAVDLSEFSWTDGNWVNFDLSEYIIYELHTGTFTDAGTFSGIEERLDYLKDLGITAIEIMPVAAFPGTRNWGYDGVFPFAVQESYGGPQALQHLVNACHEKGMAVILDVVYNHLGPEGNVLTTVGPYTTAKYPTPWGEAMNMDDAGSDYVRQYFIENALLWLSEYHIDALRLDAVHAIRDFGPKHFLAELADAVRDLEQQTGKNYHLIAECDLNDRRFLESTDRAGYGMDAQWVDEFHHALRVTCGEPAEGYYSDFSGLAHLAKAFSSGYVYDGIFSSHRDRTFGTKTTGIPGSQFVVFSQNHDQVGNRAFGERSVVLYGAAKARLMAAATLLSPFVPLLFMGEEYGETRPFLYFMDHQGAELVEAVRKGRASEFSFAEGQEPPDPKAEETFLDCKLSFSTAAEHGKMFAYYKALISMRKTDPVFNAADRSALQVDHDESKQLLILDWNTGMHKRRVCFNFSDQPLKLDLPDQGEYSAVFNSDDQCWGGNGTAAAEPEQAFTIPSLSVIILAN
ncbi:malto-oligosyltrehalose trehalohydrolase [Pedobacter sp. SYP-B3415]|uniref:malto-oligosyltrehalose trehalohydrolase n=1 Tax=Pedobacter sp. SYP-B3415 TaxID=2496641 RepID=UPI00101DE3F9|nr:malto-oligosyltrehalose trehalohydrolase [Pedobacter sp. SYP-B3415]